jgi:hypothetical protein
MYGFHIGLGDHSFEKGISWPDIPASPSHLHRRLVLVTWPLECVLLGFLTVEEITSKHSFVTIDDVRNGFLDFGHEFGSPTNPPPHTNSRPQRPHSHATNPSPHTSRPGGSL